MRNDLYPYPVETLKHWYVTIVGGQSAELKPNQIGVNREALAENTDIVPYEDNVLVSKLENNTPQPLFTKEYFTVVPLDETSPDASSKSPKGEVVLPVLGEKQRDWLLEPLRIGEPVILNNVLSQRFLRGFARSLDRILKNSSGQPSIEYRDN
ncbi:MAG: hypothetical protein OIN66_15490 [Candidatus Methanoperedens sp.]|nr:hypothetical protein [Candidatus Methanoperedens sp.]